MQMPLLFSFWFTVTAYVVHVLDESLLGGSFVERVYWQLDSGALDRRRVYCVPGSVLSLGKGQRNAEEEKLPRGAKIKIRNLSDRRHL
jgi:hypothetical protein